MKAGMITISTALSLLAAAAVAGPPDESVTGTSTKNASANTAIEVDKLVDGRRAGFWMSASTLGSLRALAESGADAPSLFFGAQVLNNWSKAMPGLFPAGSVNAKSNALPTIWDDPEGFEAAARQYQSDTAHLMGLLKAGDTDGFKSSINDLKNTCAGCHDKYRKETARQ